MSEPVRRVSGVEVGSATFADELLDEVLPTSLRWRTLVARYPGFSLATAAGFGFWMARQHGRLVMTAVATWVGSRVSDAVEHGLTGAD